MHVDIFSDTICPWCFIGKRQFEEALRMRPQPDLVVRWRTFQLNPQMPLGGMDRNSYLAAKFGGAANAARIYYNIYQMGQSVGLDFNFEHIERTPNTLKSHELLHFAAQNGGQDRLVERLFELYFKEGANIGELNVLLGATADVGLDPDAARAALESGSARENVEAEDQQAREAGIQGVPTFIFNGRYALSGAQEAKVLAQMFDLPREEHVGSSAV